MTTPPAPRYLAAEGGEVWARLWARADYEAAGPAVVELALTVCEQIDERLRLRAAVLRHGEWRDRVALRALDLQITTGLAAFHDRTAHGSTDRTSFDDLLAALVDDTEP